MYWKLIVLFSLYHQNSLKLNKGISRIIYIPLNTLYREYLKTIAFISASYVEYKN